MMAPPPPTTQITPIIVGIFLLVIVTMTIYFGTHRKKLKKKSSKLIISCVCISFVFATVLGVWQDTKQSLPIPPSQRYYDYTVIISSENGASYTAFLPLPMDENGSVSQMADNLIVKDGTATFEIMETEHGVALKVEGVGDVCLRSTGTGKGYFAFGLQNENELKEEGDVEYWVYSSASDNLDIKIVCESSYYGPWRFSCIYGVISTDWQTILGWEGHVFL